MHIIFIHSIQFIFMQRFIPSWRSISDLYLQQVANVGIGLNGHISYTRKMAVIKT